MLYDQARDLVETGDVILVTTSHSWLSRLTQIVTRSPYHHAGVAIWIGNRLYMAELNGGRNHTIPMSQLVEFDVYKRPAEVTVEGATYAIYQWLAQVIEYGFGAFLAIGLLNLCRIKLFVHWRKYIVCSGFVVAILETAGWPERSRVISPRELAEQLELKISVRIR